MQLHRNFLRALPRRPGAGGLRRLGVQTRHQVLVHVRAPGQRAIRLPPPSVGDPAGLQRGAHRPQDHRSPGRREDPTASVE